MAAAALLLALVIFGLLPFTYAAPVIGLVLALCSPPDYAGQARPVARRTRNAVVGVALIAALGVVIWQPQLTLLQVLLAGMDSSGLVVTVVAVIALALPLAMTEATSDEWPAGWFLLTRRSLILSVTILVSVATWYGALGHNFIPIAVFVLVLPMLIGFSRLVAAPKGRLDVGHGGRAELINYHHTGSMQRIAVEIMRVGEGGIHRPGRTDLASYFIHDQPVLAPADGTVTYGLDGRTTSRSDLLTSATRQVIS